MHNIIVFGKNGQVGSALFDLLANEKDFNTSFYGRSDVDFSDLKSLENFLENLPNIPHIIINACAYTNVDKAEAEREMADNINHKAVLILAQYAAKNNVFLIHYSTDYVFDGSGDEPFTEDNVKNLKPLNHYGQTKLDGENAIIKSGCNYIILRTSWVFSEDAKFKNFVNTIKRLALEKEEINVVDDQIGAPTNAFDIANVTLKLVKKVIDLNFLIKEIFHFTGDETMSWYQFAFKIIDSFKGKCKLQKIHKVKTKDYQSTAFRPLNSRLSYIKLKLFLNE